MLGGLRSSVCQSVEGGEEVKETARCVSGKSAWRVSRASSRPPLVSLGQHSLLEVPPLKNSARPMRLTGLIFALPPRRTRTVPRGGDSFVYRRPYFTGLRISTQTVSFTIDNFSSFLTQNRTLTALYTFLLLSGPPSDYIADVELWLSTALIFNNRPSITSPHKQAFHRRGVSDISPPWR